MNHGPAPIRKPTEAELDLLRALWKRPNATVREVQDLLSEQRSVGYTTVLKTLQIMMDKGLVVRVEAERAHRYSAAVAEKAMQKHLLLDLTDRLFAGSSTALAMRALSIRPPSDDELEQIRALIEQKRGKD